MLGADRVSDFFKIDWQDQKWNLMFIAGTILGGFISAQWLTPDPTVAISANTIADLQAIGIANPGAGYVPEEIFGADAIWSLRSLVFLIGGGFLVGFGTRYANGCTSGHAISGLSNLQYWSLIAVIGFFIGGLLMTHVLLPYLINL